MTFQKGNTYNPSDPDLPSFITNTQFDRKIRNVVLLFTIVVDMQYSIQHPQNRRDTASLIICIYLYTFLHINNQRRKKAD